jgi:hypothetical protein
MLLTRLLAIAALAALTLVVTPRVASAQTQVKPYFLIIFDTSGSMNETTDTSPTDDTPLPNSCGYQTTTGPMDDRFTAPRKMDAAKCALGKILNATGDADFGLMQFAQSDGGCGNGDTCTPEISSAQMRVAIESNTSGGILSLIDKAGMAPVNELCAGGYTPLGGTLVAAKAYFEGELAGFEAPTVGDTGLACRPLSVILLTDGLECCNDCDDDEDLFTTGCPKANATLMAAGKGTCVMECGFGGGCGNAGNLDAFESAPEKAFELLNETMVPSASGMVAKQIRTYTVGFGITPGQARIERIATGGGTDASNGGGGNRAFYASDETGLALAFSQIIADSQPPAEECNGADDDCDTLIDEGFPKYCDLHATPPITTPILCEEPNETLCDGIDDDCDGILDEGTMNECGACGEETPAEVCDGFDNDCDGTIDEGTGGGACGRDEGECMSGELVCEDGMLDCEGEVGPEPEQCNGKDDDCDGMIDEDPTGILCPDGRCVAGQCSPFCDVSEFAETCANGRRPERQPSGECLCIIDDCDREACAEMTIEQDDEALCAPGRDDIAACTCRGGGCTFNCDGVTCRDDQICDPRRGLCVLDDCRGLGCPDGQLCDFAAKECVTDECVDADCDDTEVCRRGVCEKSCGDIQCDDGETCKAGRCVENGCAEIQCAEDDFCDPQSQTCEDDPCALRSCGEGLVCVSTTGDCERDPCFGVRCPDEQACRGGECRRLGDDGDPVQVGNPSRLLATGGGGCSCSTVGGSSGGGSQRSGLAGLLALAFACATFMRARRRKNAGGAQAQTLIMVALALAGTLSSGCSVEPFCVNCVSLNGNDGGGSGGSSGVGNPTAGSGAGNAGSAGNAGNAGAAGSEPDDGGIDADVDGCVERFEECNAIDDDCDGRVDEKVEPTVNGCEQRGICGGSEPACVAGQFKCQFPAEREDEETLCDELDNDCDGKVDEAFPTLGDTCSLGVGQCSTPGTLECNGAGTGVLCVIGDPLEPGDEVCDGIDNDCDGVADEPASDPGMNDSFVRDELVQVAASVWMYKYEASRPDATDDEQGIIGERACSKADVMPWTNVTYDEAVDACEAAGLSLCTEAQWLDGCNGSANNCVWGFTPTAGSCSVYPLPMPPAMPTVNRADACNGHDLGATPGGADNDALDATGSYARCFATQMASGQIFDLSGNAKEWVTDDSTAGTLPAGSNPTRGGSYNNLPGGMRCDFSFSAANNGVRLRNIGFRCCTTTAPP